MSIFEIISALAKYYTEEPIKLVGLFTWLLSWWAANLLAKTTEHGFLAHLIYSVSNVLLFVFNFYYGHVEMCMMAITFLQSSIRGCINYYPVIKKPAL